MTDPIARPGDTDPAIEQATDEVVDTWDEAAPGKEPQATTADFARMRDGFGRIAEDGTIEEADETDAGGGSAA